MPSRPQRAHDANDDPLGSAAIGHQEVVPPVGLQAVWGELDDDEEALIDEPWAPRRRTPSGIWGVRLGPVGEAGRRVEQRRTRIRMLGLTVVVLSVLSMLVVAAFIVRQWENIRPMLSVDSVVLDEVGVEGATTSTSVMPSGTEAVSTTMVAPTGPQTP